MSFIRLQNYKQLYATFLPVMTLYSTILGIDTGFTKNRKEPNGSFNDSYSNLIGYTSIGIVTGITYPISFPLLGCYVLYKNR
jgi:hypothetical protein